MELNNSVYSKICKVRKRSNKTFTGQAQRRKLRLEYVEFSCDSLRYIHKSYASLTWWILCQFLECIELTHAEYLGSGTKMILMSMVVEVNNPVAINNRNLLTNVSLFFLYASNMIWGSFLCNFILVDSYVSNRNASAFENITRTVNSNCVTKFPRFWRCASKTEHWRFYIDIIMLKLELLYLSVTTQ